jgi:hypothetical protein
MTLALFAFAYAGLAMLSFAMDRHHDQFFVRPSHPLRRLVLRVAGGALLLAGFAAATSARGWSIGPVAFVSALSVGGLLLVLLLAVSARYAALVAALALAAGGVAIIGGY